MIKLNTEEFKTPAAMMDFIKREHAAKGTFAAVKRVKHNLTTYNKVVKGNNVPASIRVPATHESCKIATMIYNSKEARQLLGNETCDFVIKKALPSIVESSIQRQR